MINYKKLSNYERKKNIYFLPVSFVKFNTRIRNSAERAWDFVFVGTVDIIFLGMYQDSMFSL